MNIAILAPSPVPLAIGGAENLWWGLLEHLNANTEHHADLIKLPTPERDFWEIVDSYRRWSELDVSGYDVVISGKYPAWMPAHPRHVIYLLHPLRGLYDTYPAGWPLRCEDPHPEVAALVNFLEAGGQARTQLAECFARLEAIRARTDLDPATFALPAPLIRQVVHFLDAIGRAPAAIARSVALSHTVAQRPDYFTEADVPAAYAPTRLGGLHLRRGRHLFTVSRLDAPKRIALLIEAMAQVEHPRAQLHIAGTGPQEPELRALAGDDPRIRFRGFLNAEQLADAYARSQAVLFAPAQEDYGYITVEAMLSAKPVITTTDAGGPTELVTHRRTGFIVDPTPEALAAAITQVLEHPVSAGWMGLRARRHARQISWENVVATLLDGLT